MRRLRTSLDVFLPQTTTVKHSNISTDADYRQPQLTQLQFQSQEPSYWIPEWNSLSEGLTLTQSNSFNMFCPFCGNFISDKQNAMGCSFKRNERIYLSHFSCLRDSTFSLSQDLSELREARISYEKLPKQLRILALGEKQFFVTIQIMHPISGFTYFKGSKKLIFNNRSLIWDMNQNKSQFLAFEPNMICVPLTEFKMVISFLDMSDKEKRKEEVKILVDLSRSSNAQSIASFSVLGFGTDISGECSIHTSDEEKRKIIDEMNFKYKFSSQIPESIVRMNKVEIVIKDIRDSISEISQSMISIDSSVMGYLKPELSRHAWGYSSHSSTEINPEDLFRSNDKIEESIQPPPILPKQEDCFWKNHRELKEYVTSHSGSKQFQKTIQHMKPDEVDTIIQTLYNDFPELIVHQYANYMFQSLIIVCSLQQRLNILETLRENLPNLACTKQGTFSLQQLISFLTHEEEFSLVCSSIEKCFLALSMDQHGTHFIRKLIKSFPGSFLVAFASECADNFVNMVQDKNGICVVKAFFSIMKNCEENSALMEVRKKMVNQMVLNIDSIIQNQFGNYIIQEAFEQFGEKAMRSVSDMIVENFSYYSTEKYASNVVLKCIKDYWRDLGVYDSLRDKLRNSDIASMYKNREGNRVLLEVIEVLGYHPIEEKIQEVVLRQEPSRFHSQKWANSSRRSRTGTVGTNFKSFTDAVRPHESVPMRKKNSNARKLH